MSKQSVVSQRVPGEVGAWVFIVGDMFIFTALFAVILYHKNLQPELFASSQQLLNQSLGLVNTLFLLVGSLCVVRATAALHQAKTVLCSRYLLAAIACGAGFVCVKAVEYGSLIHHGFWIHSNDYFMLFFVITGAHLLHLLIGVAVLSFLVKRLVQRETSEFNHSFFEAGCCYWHMVDLLWLVLFPLFYLVNAL